jgi:hypothetical protein
MLRQADYMLALKYFALRRTLGASLQVITCVWLLTSSATCTYAQEILSIPLGMQSVLPVPSNPVPVTSSGSISQEEQAKRVMCSALLSGVWGPPVHCLISQEINLRDRRLFGSGEYARGSSGLGEMKLVLKIAAGDHLNCLNQVSDGRTLRVLHTIADKEEGSHVDLVRVREYLGRFSEQDRADPLVALHLAIGGQNEKLRALCTQYKWVSIKPGKFSQPGRMGEIDVWWLHGQRNTAEAALHGTAKIDAMMAAADDAGIAPSSATIAIGRTSPLQYWLYHVEEVRHPKASHPAGYAISAKMDYYQPVIRDMPPNMFHAEDYASSAGTDIDETQKYQPPPRAPTVHTAGRTP